jgi:hypothetical protein
MEPARYLRYARRVKSRPRIEVPSKRDDELPLRSLIATSVACACAGLSIAYAITDRGAQRPNVDVAPAASAPAITFDDEASLANVPPQPADHPVAVAVQAQAPDAALPEATLSDAALPNAALAASAAAPPEPAPAAPTEVARPSDPPHRLSVAPSFIAYLRCEGVRQRKGRYPCPRDRALELGMREVIQNLPTCREAHAISRGMFDVRLELGKEGAVTDLHVKAPNEDADRAVRACAAAAFRKLHTTLRPTRMIVSMRFKAR